MSILGDSAAPDLLLLGLARDCAHELPGFFSALGRLNVEGLRVCAVVGENDSRDASRELLESYARSSGALRVVDTSPMTQGGSRLERMAIGRSMLAEQIKEVAAPVVGVIDLDEPFLAALSVDTVRAAVARARRGKEFAVAATSRPTYYDLLAYEDEHRSFVGLEGDLARRRRRPLSFYRLHSGLIYPEQQRLTVDEDLTCHSAFNGFALYRRDYYSSGNYLQVDRSAPWICEHVTFNRSVHETTGLDMVVDSRLVLPAPRDHVRASPAVFLWRRGRKRLRRPPPVGSSLAQRAAT